MSVVDAPEKQAIIAGIGISRIGRRTGIPHLDLTVESARAAIADAGLEPSDIDGIATLGDTPVSRAARALGIEPTTKVGGFDTGGLLSPVMSAFLTVAAGRARHVLVYRTVQMIGGSIIPDERGTRDDDLVEDGEDDVVGGDAEPSGLMRAMGGMEPLLAAQAFSAVNWLAMHCQRHMHLHGTTKEQLGWLAVNSRRNAGLNPLAVYREPMTLDDYFAARMVSTPLGLYDCDVPVDGSIAVVVSAADHADACPNGPIRVEAIGGSDGAGGWVHRPDYPKMAAVDAAAEMWSRTDVAPGDVDIAQLYDGFTFLTLSWLEALGLCGDGEAGPFVEGGTRIALDGALPLNTYGGQLSAGRMHGYWVLHEACLQLRGDAGDHARPGRGRRPGPHRAGRPRARPVRALQVIPVEGLPEIRPGDRLAPLLAAVADLRDGDVVVVTQKVVSKAEGRMVAVDADDPSAWAAVVEAESVRILRRRGPLMISETSSGFICANAGVDRSNVPDGFVTLLPLDADRSARRIRDGLANAPGVDVGVIVSDTFGRTWRNGVTDVAIGCAGIAAVVDLRGTNDGLGRPLEVTEVAVADELASAAELVMGKASGVAAAVIRGVDPTWFRSSSVRAEIVRAPGEDLFR